MVYSGVAMGQLFKGKLKPDQALAHFAGLNREAVAVAEEVPHNLNLPMLQTAVRL